MSIEAQQHASDAANERGSLLLEALVAFAILSAMMVAILSTYTVFQRANRSAIAEQDAMQAMLFLLDDMTRELKVSVDFGWDTVPNPDNLRMNRLDTVNSNMTVEVRYRLSGGRIQKNVDAAGWLPMTPEAFTITSFTAEVLPSNAPSGELRRVLVTITAQPTNANSAPVYLQTTLSEREQKNP